MDNLLRTLGDSARRSVLTALHEGDLGTDPWLAYRDLGIESVPPDVRTVLHHVHLPHLDEAGFIDWDRERRRITYGPRWEQIAPVVAMFIERQDDLPGEWP
jgi:hypothetical protein